MDAKIDVSAPMQAAMQSSMDLLSALTSGQAAMFQSFADSHQRKADRLAAFEKDLVAEVGEQDPEVLAVRAEKEQSARFAAAVTRTLKRAQTLMSAKVAEAAGVVGSVRTAEGALAQGVTVQLVATTGKTEKKLATARTNQFGDFSINLAPSDVSSKATLHLVVQNEAGQTIASQPVKVSTAQVGASFVPLTMQPPPEDTTIVTGATDAKPVEDKPKATRAVEKETPPDDADKK